jgi:archaeal flagellar protein FlaJ
LRSSALRKKTNQRIFLSIFIGVIAGIVAFFIKRSWPISLLFFAIGIALPLLQYFMGNNLKNAARIKKMEDLFPDFLQLMSSNLRAGITVDRSMLLSAREEFDPLNKEILETGRDITTGKDIQRALLDMSKRINSEKINKTILLILSGIRAGGDLATLLEQTAVNTRERSFVEKRAASNVLMYVIFIFIAVSMGAPALFALSNLLVEILTTLLAGLPAVEVSNAPFTLSTLSISTQFVFYFSIAFIVCLDILAALVLGLVSKGEERDGFKYLIPLLLISLGIFFIVKLALSGFVKSFFA